MATIIDITALRAIFAGGKFDTDFRYVRNQSSDTLSNILSGPTMNIAYNGSFGVIAWRYLNGGYALNGPDHGGDVALPAAPSNTSYGIAM